MSNPKILDHLDHPRYLEVATYGDHGVPRWRLPGSSVHHDRGDTNSITVECIKCGVVVHTLWERGAENDEKLHTQGGLDG